MQEALTNVIRHAQAETANVRVEYQAAAVLVEIIDDGRSVVSGIPGHGVVGMRERARSVGGTLDAGVCPGGFRSLLEHTEGVDIVGEAADGRRAVELARRTKPDLILMDIRMPVLDGIEATRQICADPGLSGVRVVVLTTFELDEYVFAALRAGAGGFLLKEIEPEDLRRAVRIWQAAMLCSRRASPDGSLPRSPRNPPDRPSSSTCWISSPTASAR